MIIILKKGRGLRSKPLPSPPILVDFYVSLNSSYKSHLMVRKVGPLKSIDRQKWIFFHCMSQILNNL